MSGFCSRFCNEISRCCYDFYHTPFTKKNLLIAGGVLLGLIILIIIIVCASRGSSSSGPSSGKELLSRYPLIDGANSLAYNLKLHLVDEISIMGKDALYKNLAEYYSNTLKCDSCQTDFQRLKTGHVATQVLSVSSDCKAQYKDAVSQTLEQIDLIKRIIANSKNELALVTESKDIETYFNSKRTGIIINLWGGHNIDSRLGVLRMYYDLGVRMISPVASDSNDNPCLPPWIESNGAFSDFGKSIVKEINRLGMIIDLTGSTEAVQISLLSLSSAPVIYSHSGSYFLTSSKLNVPDSILNDAKYKDKVGLVMVPFTPSQLKNATTGASTMDSFTSHVETLSNSLTTSKIGIGSNFDNMTTLTMNLTDVSKFPTLFDHLLDAKSTKSVTWNQETLKKIAGGNFIDVFKSVEKNSDVTGGAEDSFFKDYPTADQGCYSDLSVRNITLPTPAPTTTTPTKTPPTPTNSSIKPTTKTTTKS